MCTAGNEDAVEVYINFTGLMWELGRELNALLIFAEVRSAVLGHQLAAFGESATHIRSLSCGANHSLCCSIDTMGRASRWVRALASTSLHA